MLQDHSTSDRVPVPPEKSCFFPIISMPWKVLENEFGFGKSWGSVLESPGVYLWFKLYNVHMSLGSCLLKHRTACVNKCAKYSCKPKTSFSTCDEYSAIRLWIVPPHCIFWVSNCRLSLHLNIAGLLHRPGKSILWSFKSPGIFGSKSVGTLERYCWDG